MITNNILDLHLLRPWWSLALLPLLILFWRLYKINTVHTAWSAICDKQLLKYLLKTNDTNNRYYALLCLFFSNILVVVSLMGPCWSKHFVRAYNTIDPYVIILDISDTMLTNDILPNRLMRAKFKLHDLFAQQNNQQFGLIIFTGEPFIIAPLTSDVKTIDALLSSIIPDIMPVSGYDLSAALYEAATLINNANLYNGHILVLTATIPNSLAITTAEKLAIQGFSTSIMPITSNHDTQFQYFATKGHGSVLTLSADIMTWIMQNKYHYALDKQKIIIWHDVGQWFLVPALLLMIMVFRRNWLQRISI